MNPRPAEFRIRAEILIAAVAGMIFTWKCPQWFDPDEVVGRCWTIGLLGGSVAFGVFGRCPVLRVGLGFAFGSFVLLLSVPSYLRGGAVVYIPCQYLFVLIGAAAGQGSMRYWSKPEAISASEPSATPNGGSTKSFGNSTITEQPPTES